MNGEDLVYDWQHNVVDEPDEWAFNWKYPACGTAKPTPRKGHATLWITVNFDDDSAETATPIEALRTFLTTTFQQENMDIKLRARRLDPDKHHLRIYDNRRKVDLLKGSMRIRGPSDNDAKVGNYAEFRSTSEEGLALIERFVQLTKDSIPIVAMAKHERIDIRLENDYKLTIVTGTGPDSVDNNHDLATHFYLTHTKDVIDVIEVAKCHLSYKDGSWDSSLGPSIEMIDVYQPYRGKGLAKLLWYWVRRFIEDNFTFECKNTGAPLQHVMIKATQVGQQEVEICVDKDGETRHPVGFKQFIYDYCGFSVRELKGPTHYVLGRGRPKDEEAVLYVPMIDRQSLDQRKQELYRTIAADQICTDGPKPGVSGYMREKCGKRMCHWCNNVALDLLRCSRCGIAFYCNAACQKNDWKRHKKWCTKTRDQIKELMIAEGHFVPSDCAFGYSMVMNGPNRTYRFAGDRGNMLGNYMRGMGL